MALKVPVAETHFTTNERHGYSLQDEYFWLKDPNWQEVMRDPSRLDSKIRSYLDAENEYTQEMLSPIEDLGKQLLGEMKGRINQDDSTVPLQDGEYFYYQRFEVGAEHPVFCRKRGEGDTPEELLLDVESMSEGTPFFRLSECKHSPNHRYLAYSIDTQGSEFYSLIVKDLETGDTLDDKISDTQGSVVWGNDSRTLYYTRLDKNHRPSSVFRHNLDDDAENDTLIFEESDPSFFVTISKTESRRFVVIKSSDHSLTGEICTVDANQPNSEPLLFSPRETGIDYEVSDQGDRFFVLTNAEGSVDYKIMETPLSLRERVHWREVEPHTTGRLILEFNVTDTHLVWLERAEGLSNIVVKEISNGQRHEVGFDEEVYDLKLIRGFEYFTKVLRFTYSSLTRPKQVFDYDMEKRTRVLLKEQCIPTGHDPSKYLSRMIWASSYDGAKVPISLFYSRSTAIDGNAPLLLYGYGSYGHSIPASFSANRLSLVDRGFVYAIAHIRGGSDKGYQWYFDGKLDHKQNTFLDYLAVADHLISEGYTTQGNIVGHGGSAGGMLMGCVANMRPDLFKAILAEVPFVDVLNTMCDAELPLTPPEWSEWGNPIEEKEAYEIIRSYCPYSNVSRQAYPHILVTAGLTDPRVTYWEPAKWVAKLRALKTNETKLLLRTNMEAGHSGASGRFKKLEEVALVYAFALSVFGDQPALR